MFMYKPAINSYTRANYSKYLSNPIKLRLYVYKAEKILMLYEHKPVKINARFLARIFRFEIN